MRIPTTFALLASLTCSCHDSREPEMQPASGKVESVRVVDGNTTVKIDRSDVPLVESPAQASSPSEQTSEALRVGILAIIDSRCEAEMKCGNIGVSRKFETLAACQRQNSDEVRSRFETNECRTNFDRHVLEKCLTALGEDECNASTEPLQRIESCRTTAICTG